jgi:uncharacterized protein YoxC
MNAEIVLWCLGGLLTAVCILIGTIYAIYRNVINKLENTNTELSKDLSTKSAEIKRLYDKFTNTESTSNRLWTNIEQTIASVTKEIEMRCHNDEELHKRIDEEIKDRQSKHDAFGQRVYTDLDKIKDRVADLSETVAGFSGIYVTRTEHREDEVRRTQTNLKRPS